MEEPDIVHTIVNDLLLPFLIEAGKGIGYGVICGGTLFGVWFMAFVLSTQ